MKKSIIYILLFALLFTFIPKFDKVKADIMVVSDDIDLVLLNILDLPVNDGYDYYTLYYHTGLSKYYFMLFTLPQKDSVMFNSSVAERFNTQSSVPCRTYYIDSANNVTGGTNSNITFQINGYTGVNTGINSYDHIVYSTSPTINRRIPSGIDYGYIGDINANTYYGGLPLGLILEYLSLKITLPYYVITQSNVNNNVFHLYQMNVKPTSFTGNVLVTKYNYEPSQEVYVKSAHYLAEDGYITESEIKNETKVIDDVTVSFLNTDRILVTNIHFDGENITFPGIGDFTDEPVDPVDNGIFDMGILIRNFEDMLRNLFMSVMGKLFLPTTVISPSGVAIPQALDEIMQLVQEKFQALFEIGNILTYAKDQINTGAVPPLINLQFMGVNSTLIDFSQVGPYTAPLKAFITALLYVKFIFWVVKFAPTIVKG